MQDFMKIACKLFA